MTATRLNDKNQQQIFQSVPCVSCFQNELKRSFQVRVIDFVSPIGCHGHRAKSAGPTFTNFFHQLGNHFLPFVFGRNVLEGRPNHFFVFGMTSHASGFVHGFFRRCGLGTEGQHQSSEGESSEGKRALHKIYPKDVR